MKRILFILIATSLLLGACRSAKEKPDYNKVDESFEDFKDRNPDK